MLEVNVTRHPKGRSVIPDSPEVVAAWIAGKPEGWRGTMRLADFKKIRSHRKNKTVWGFWLPIVLEERGYYPHDAQYVYDQIKIGMGWTEDRVDKRTEEVTKVPKPTANLSDDEYLVWMRNWRGYVEDQDAGLGIPLPEPDPAMARI